MRGTTLFKLAFLVTAGVLAGCQGQPDADTNTTETATEAIIPGGTPQAGIIGRTEVAQAQHCTMAQILAVANPLQRFQAAFDCGDHLFSAQFN